jgi:hypothetical protein
LCICPFKLSNYKAWFDPELGAGKFRSALRGCEE